MQLPVDTTNMTFISAGEPEPLMEHDTDRQRTDKGGQPIFTVRLVALSGSEADVIVVRIGPSKGIVQGPVRVTGLTARPWTMGERSGITYQATHIEPVAAARQAS